MGMGGRLDIDARLRYGVANMGVCSALEKRKPLTGLVGSNPTYSSTALRAPLTRSSAGGSQDYHWPMFAPQRGS